MGRQAHAVYDYFALENDRAKYRLDLGAYNGTAGNGMRACWSSHNNDGMPFSTPDRDNDNNSGNCAQEWSADGGTIPASVQT